MNAPRAPDDDLFESPTDARSRAANRLASVVGPPRRARSRQRFPRGEAWRKIVEAATEMMSSGDWSTATPKHHVALFEVRFAATYEVEAGLGTKDRQRACFVAAAMLRDKFAGDSGAMADYEWWAWSREAEREEWRRHHGKSGGTLSWRRLFGAELYTEWRIDGKRTASRPGR